MTYEAYRLVTLREMTALKAAEEPMLISPITQAVREAMRTA